MSPFKAAVENAMDYEFAMSKVKALTQMRNIREGNLQQVTKNMAALDAQAKQLGASTEYTATEIANAMSFYGMAGWDTERIQAIMQSTVDLASIAGDHNIARTADVLSDDLSALGMKAGRQMRLTSGKVVEESQYFADAFAYAITQANLNRESLHEALKYNAPTSHAAGLSLGETLAMNMISANAGIKGSMAGTAFRAGWTRFLAPPKTAAKALQEMGLEASDATKSVLEAQAALKEIGVAEDANLFTKITQAYQHYQGLEQNQKAGWLKNLVGQNALSAWQIVFDTGNIEQIAKIAQEIDSGAIAGWSKDTAGVMRDNTHVEFELLKSAIDACANSVGNVFLPAIRSAMSGLAEGASAFNTWIQNNQTAVQWAGLLAAAVSGIIVASAGIALVGAAFSFISSGIMVAVNAVRAVVVAFNAARVAVMGFGAVSAAAAAIASAPIWAIAAAVVGVIAVIGYATGAFDGLGDAIANAWNHPQGAITGFCELAKSAVDSAVNYVVNRWNTLRSALAHPIDAMINFLDHGDVIGGNVISGEQQAALTAHATASGGTFHGGGGEIDTAPVQAALDNVGNAAQVAAQNFTSIDATVTNAAQNLSSVDMAATNTAQNLSNVDMAATNTAQNLSNVDMAATNTATNLSNVDMAATNTATNLTNVDTSAQTVATSLLSVPPNVDTLNAALPLPVGNLQALGDAAGSAVGGILSLGDAAGSAAGALAAKAAEISAIVINAPQVNLVPVNIPVSGGAPTQSNARGGIYPRGEFLTTFAERSPEAAIPIDSSARAKNLWFETGRLLGFNNILPGNKPRVPITRPRVNRFPINRPRVNRFPFGVMTPPTFPEINQPTLEPTLERGASNINITINVHIEGNADRQEVQRGIEDALPRVESFADQLAAYNHERRRVSYA